METIPAINVTLIEPRLRHATIFKHFDELLPGRELIIFNDHDPKPLYYQLLGERGDTFTWKYLQEGPENWQVKIAKRAMEDKEETVGQIASKDIRMADAFRKLGIDFCCGGKRKLKDALRHAGVTPEQLEETLIAAATLPAAQQPLNFAAWQPGFLIDYIVNVHHRYILENGPIIEGLASKVASRHADRHPELLALSEQVQQLLSDLYSHLEKEEGIVFPAIKQIANTASNEYAQDAPDLNLVVGLMEAEHASAGDDLKRIREISSNYHLPQGACNSYTYLFEKLKEFENDLFNHIHLENNILFPKALEIGRQPQGQAV
ncbi:Iron-sulfur cluster repair protein YtfE [Dyadobacter sp. CECT 9275]|uniref:Iron-sulfur cluster repair protein YtfE n=1 Tax=Dyadobacter helix TaxID=2822344 RepID=A0A916JEK0_9BACT|nr:iron-sulfur cluster repair di-iron protein [Dyadobacter sp. CECT 9275]CAG5001352.1 Iron-sulfur cluster repair protein YtfE [Dyadobacter sp. CECT 9275]